MLVAMYNTQNLSESHNSSKSSEKCDKNFEYTFQNKQRENDENRDKVLRFDDPYMYSQNAAQLNLEQKSQTVISHLHDYLQKHKSTHSSRSMPYSERQNCLQNVESMHQYSSSLKENQLDASKDVWEKSFELLKKLNSERDFKIEKIQKKKKDLSSERFPLDILEEISNYKVGEIYRPGSRSRSSGRSK